MELSFGATFGELRCEYFSVFSDFGDRIQLDPEKRMLTASSRDFRPWFCAVFFDGLRRSCEQICSLLFLFICLVFVEQFVFVGPGPAFSVVLNSIQ